MVVMMMMVVIISRLTIQTEATITVAEKRERCGSCGRTMIMYLIMWSLHGYLFFLVVRTETDAVIVVFIVVLGISVIPLYFCTCSCYWTKGCEDEKLLLLINTSFHWMCNAHGSHCVFIHIISLVTAILL